MTTYHPIIERDLEEIVSAPYPWESLAGKTIMVTGANGLVPGYSVETALFLNHKWPSRPKVKVIALVRNVEKTARRFAHHAGDPNLKIIESDLTKPVNCEGPVDYIVHGASPADPRFYTAHPSQLFITNGLGTFHLFELAREKKTSQFLLVSSGEVYGKLDFSQLPAKEDVFGAIDPMRVRSCMSESKRFAENMSVCLGAEYGITAKVARLCHTFGPGMRLDDGRVFADFIGDVLNKRPIKLKSDGSPLRTFCYLADATQAMFAIIFFGTAGEAYNVASRDATITIKNFAEMVTKQYGTGELSFPENLKVSTQSPGKEIWPDCTPDPTKVERLGWRPSTSLKEAVGRTIAYLSSSSI